jgi:hypothetical protein
MQLKIVTALFITFLAISTVNAMSLFDAGPICTFSSVRAKVTRITRFKDTVTDVTSTDDSGAFSFPANFSRSVKKFLPMETVITQQILVNYQGKSYEIWANGKMNSEEDSELGGLPIDLSCELTEEPRTFRSSGSLILTNCHWDKE